VDVACDEGGVHEVLLLILTYRNSIFACIFCYNIPRSSAESQSRSLTNSYKVSSVVLSEDFPLGIYYVSRLFWERFLEKFFDWDFSYEA